MRRKPTRANNKFRRFGMKHNAIIQGQNYRGGRRE